MRTRLVLFLAACACDVPGELSEAQSLRVSEAVKRGRLGQYAKAVAEVDAVLEALGQPGGRGPVPVQAGLHGSALALWRCRALLLLAAGDAAGARRSAEVALTLSSTPPSQGVDRAHSRQLALQEDALLVWLARAREPDPSAPQSALSWLAQEVRLAQRRPQPCGRGTGELVVDGAVEPQPDTDITCVRLQLGTARSQTLWLSARALMDGRTAEAAAGMRRVLTMPAHPDESTLETSLAHVLGGLPCPPPGDEVLRGPRALPLVCPPDEGPTRSFAEGR